MQITIGRTSGDGEEASDPLQDALIQQLMMYV